MASSVKLLLAVVLVVLGVLIWNFAMNVQVRPQTPVPSGDERTPRAPARR